MQSEQQKANRALKEGDTAVIQSWKIHQARSGWISYPGL
jgi:hypothetical protein